MPDIVCLLAHDYKVSTIFITYVCVQHFQNFIYTITIAGYSRNKNKQNKKIFACNNKFAMTLLGILMGTS